MAVMPVIEIKMTFMIIGNHEANGIDEEYDD